jgi:hypothetical protein
MSAVDTRSINRDSLFMMAVVRFEGSDAEYRVKVRNLSAGGMMAEGDVRIERGRRLQIELRNLGWVQGTVAWLQDNRFGIAFAEDIDPRLARQPVAAPSGESFTPRFVRPASLLPPDQLVDPSRLRKI